MDKTDKKYSPYKVSPGAQVYVAELEAKIKELKSAINVLDDRLPELKLEDFPTIEIWIAFKQALKK